MSISVKRSIIMSNIVCMGFPGGARGKESPANAGDTGDLGSTPGLQSMGSQESDTTQ